MVRAEVPSENEAARKKYVNKNNGERRRTRDSIYKGAATRNPGSQWAFWGARKIEDASTTYNSPEQYFSRKIAVEMAVSLCVALSARGRFATATRFGVLQANALSDGRNPGCVDLAESSNREPLCRVGGQSHESCCCPARRTPPIARPVRSDASHEAVILLGKQAFRVPPGKIARGNQVSLAGGGRSPLTVIFYPIRLIRVISRADIWG